MNRLLEHIQFGYSDFAGIVFALLAAAVFVLYVYQLEEKPDFNIKTFAISAGVLVLLPALYYLSTLVMHRIFLWITWNQWIKINLNNQQGFILCILLLLPLALFYMNKLARLVQGGVFFLSAMIIFLVAGLAGAVLCSEKAVLFYIPVIIMILCKMFPHPVFCWISLCGIALCLFPEIYFSIKDMELGWSGFCFSIFLWMIRLSFGTVTDVRSRTYDVKERMKNIVSIKSDRRN